MGRPKFMACHGMLSFPACDVRFHHNFDHIQTDTLRTAFPRLTVTIQFQLCTDIAILYMDILLGNFHFWSLKGATETANVNWFIIMSILGKFPVKFSTLENWNFFNLIKWFQFCERLYHAQLMTHDDPHFRRTSNQHCIRCVNPVYRISSEWKMLERLLPTSWEVNV